MGGQPAPDPGSLRRVSNAEGTWRWRGHRETGARSLGCPRARLADIGRQLAESTLAVLQDECVEIHELTNTVGSAVGGARDSGATKAVADQHHVSELFPDEDVDDIRDEDFEIDRRGQQVRPLA